MRRNVALALTAASLVAIGWLTLFAATDTFTVHSESMAPTFRAGDILVTTSDAPPRHGDAVTVRQEWDLTPGQQQDWLLRALGLPGDRVTCCTKAGSLTVNGKAEPPAGLDPSGTTFDVTVPPGHVFLVGDNRAGANDSRAHLDQQGGAVAAETVQSRVEGTIWPLWRWSPATPDAAGDQGLLRGASPRFVAGSICLGLGIGLGFALVVHRSGAWWRSRRPDSR